MLGSHSYEGGGFTTKQQFFSKVLVEVDKDGNPKRMSDVHEAEGDIERYMKGRGYWQVDGSKFAGKPLATWYHPTAGILVTDAKWANFRRDDQGFLRPLDLGVQTSR
ncbi:MAG TPA: hypothetical protein VK968_02685 [Roseimicrobium sp.]|nr:hypothetical protein [Roseimicrobium sp.]